MNEDIGLEELDFEEDDALLEPAWWAPASLLSAEASSITAFTFAVLGMFGGASIASVLVQSVVEAPMEYIGPDWYLMLSAVVAILFALGAILLGRRAIVDVDGPGWSSHLARAAVLVAAASVVLSGLAIVAGAFSGTS